jgi:hypothetical protein
MAPPELVLGERVFKQEIAARATEGSAKGLMAAVFPHAAK